MRQTLLIAALLAAPVAALAEDKATVATCGDSGCTCRLAALTPSEIEAATGIPAPPGAAAMTLVDIDGTFVWSPLSGDEVDLLMGGDGTCPLQLFDEIVPRDGTWAPAILSQTDQGCPAGLSGMLAPMLDGAAGPARAVRWGGAFDPEKMSIGPSGLTWTAEGPRAFRGSVDSVASDIVRITVDVRTRLEAEDRATGTLALEVRTRAADAAGQAVLRAAGIADCDVGVEFEFVRTGD